MDQVKKKVFVINDDLEYANSIKQELIVVSDTLEVEVFPSAEDCFQNMDVYPDLVVLHYELQPADKGVDGTMAIQQFLSLRENLEILVVTNYMTRELAMQCLLNETVSYISSKTNEEGYVIAKIYEHLFGSLDDTTLRKKAV